MKHYYVYTAEAEARSRKAFPDKPEEWKLQGAVAMCGGTPVGGQIGIDWCRKGYIEETTITEGPIPYGLLKEKGFDGLVEWYETLDIKTDDDRSNPMMVHVSETSWSKMVNVIVERYGESVRKEVCFQFMNMGPSGSRSVVEDRYRIVKE